MPEPQRAQCADCGGLLDDEWNDEYCAICVDERWLDGADDSMTDAEYDERDGHA